MAFKVYPNPATHIIRFQSIEDNSQMTIYNLKGMICLEKRIFRKELNVGQLKEGIYLLRIGNQLMLHKLIIQR